MSGYEEQFHARAEMLDETGELAAAATAILAGASSAGLDPDAIVSLRAAITALDPASGSPGYQAGSRADRHPGSGYRSDSEFLEAVSDAEDEIRGWLGDTEQLQVQVTAAAGKAHVDLERAQRDVEAARQALVAAYAMPAKNACDGCHFAKAAAIAAAEAAIADAEQCIQNAIRSIGTCEATAEILDPLTRRLQAALRALCQVPHDLGEVYELIYQFIRRGGKCRASVGGSMEPHLHKSSPPADMSRRGISGGAATPNPKPLQQGEYRCHRLRAGRRPDRYSVPPRPPAGRPDHRRRWPRLHRPDHPGQGRADHPRRRRRSRR